MTTGGTRATDAKDLRKNPLIVVTQDRGDSEDAGANAVENLNGDQRDGMPGECVTARRESAAR